MLPVIYALDEDASLHLLKDGRIVDEAIMNMAVAELDILRCPLKCPSLFKLEGRKQLQYF